MASESCETILRTRNGYFHKAKLGVFTDGWKYRAIENLISTTSFTFSFEFLEDNNPTYLMPINLVKFNTETEN